MIAYFPSVTNFLADVTTCRAATAAPFLWAATAAPFLGAHDPVGHFLWYKTPSQTPISTGPGSRVGTLTVPPYWTVWVRATAPLMTLLHEFYDWVWPIRVDEAAGLTLDLEYLNMRLQYSKFPRKRKSTAAQCAQTPNSRKWLQKGNVRPTVLWTDCVLT